jgi:hypothetical protein
MASRTNRSASNGIAAHDALRLRLFRAHRKGRTAFEREQIRIQAAHHLSDAQIDAIWARGRGAFEAEFIARVVNATPLPQRAAKRRELKELCRAARA